MPFPFDLFTDLLSQKVTRSPRTGLHVTKNDRILTK